MGKQITSQSLRKVNALAGILHLAQMAAVLALSNDFALPVTATYMSGPPGSSFAAPIVLFSTPVGLTVAIFLGLSALAHFIVASPQFFPRYSAGISAQRNYFRWVEYAISSSVMIVLIAQVTGVAEISAIISIFGVNASMILFGWLQEKYENPGSGGWLPFIFGCIAGIVPWVALMFYVLSIGGVGETSAPAFVYGIVFTIFLFFNSFALVQWLQYKKFGKWSDYMRGERTYITLSLIAKSALAWQIFANTLIS
ncbi:MAG: heliorhodopsin HeR [Acidobacteria bacterium]|nr:heliorhodopsin HeR [Acidobacteriota bacterium]